MKTYDLVVIGSGPGGAAAARTGIARGLSVALIDRKIFPREKLCGGLFTGRSEKALRQIFDLGISDDLFLTSDHMRFSADGEVLADLKNAPPVHLTMRRQLDEMLHNAAVDAGAEPILGQGVAEIDEASHTITLKDGQTIGYAVLIGADGVNSSVARHLFGRPFDPDTIGFGLEIESPKTNSRDGAVEVDFDAANWGYGWSFPKRRSLTVGVGGINSCNSDMKRNMARYVALTGSDQEMKYKGQFLPFGDYKTSPGRNDVLLVGDAAGLVDPITGEGIALAMESGFHAAQAAADALQLKDPTRAYGLYLKRIRPIHRSLRQAKQWRLIMFPALMQGSFKTAFRKGSSLQRRYLDLLAGDADYGDLRLALIRRIPKIIWGAARHNAARLLGKA